MCGGSVLHSLEDALQQLQNALAFYFEKMQRVQRVGSRPGAGAVAFRFCTPANGAPRLRRPAATEGYSTVTTEYTSLPTNVTEQVDAAAAAVRRSTESGHNRHVLELINPGESVQGLAKEAPCVNGHTNGWSMLREDLQGAPVHMAMMTHTHGFGLHACECAARARKKQ